MNNILLGGIILASLAAGAYGEHQRLSDKHNAELARLAQARAEEIATYTQSLMAGAQATDDALTLWFSKIQTAEEARDATKKQLAELTSRSRACLSARAARLLNSTNNTSPMPNAAQRAAGSAPTATADSTGFASEAAVAAWAADVSKLYSQCRAQVEALAKWRDATYTK